MSTKRNKGDDKKSLSLPLDLIIEILTRLPPKSVPKLVCVSKLWLSIIQSKQFIELYLARSSTRPRLIFKFFCGVDKHFFHSASQDSPSSDDRAINTPILDRVIEILPPIRGLIFFRDYKNVVISNPSTSQFLTLPQVNNTNEKVMKIFFGYDPVNDLYKVMCMTVDCYRGGPPVVSEEHQVFTVGAQKSEWRMIECKHPHYPVTQGICMNGVLYYGAWADHRGKRSLLVSFGLRFEDFSLIALPEDGEIKRMTRLVNFSGKIALVKESFIGKFECWVLKDVSKQEWSKFSAIHSWNDLTGNDRFHCLGSISTGELVFFPCFSTTELSFICYDPKKDKARRVGFEKPRSLAFFTNTFILDHVESPMFLPR